MASRRFVELLEPVAGSVPVGLVGGAGVGGAAVTFLSAAFGFVERTRIGASHRAQMAVGDDGAVIIADVGGDRRPPESGGATQVARCG